MFLREGMRVEIIGNGESCTACPSIGQFGTIVDVSDNDNGEDVQDDLHDLYEVRYDRYVDNGCQGYSCIFPGGSLRVLVESIL